MSVLELASLRLLPGISITDEDLLSTLRRAKSNMEASSKVGSFYYLQQSENPDIIYIVGAWPSVQYHYEVFIPSEENQRILRELEDKVVVEWLFHVDLDQKQVPLKSANVLAVGRHFIKPGEKELFQETFEGNNNGLLNATGQRMAGGWRIDKEEEGKEEFVLFTGWDDIADHKAFGDSEDFKKYAKIREHLEGAEIKHAMIIDV